MNKYEAKYQALLLGATSDQVDIAERLVQVAIDKSNANGIGFWNVFNSLAWGIREQQSPVALNIIGYEYKDKPSRPASG